MICMWIEIWNLDPTLTTDMLKDATIESTKKETSSLFDMLFGAKMQNLLDTIWTFLWVKKENTPTQQPIDQQVYTSTSQPEQVPVVSNNNEVYNDIIDNTNEKVFEDTILYLTHQQWQRGIREIIEAASHNTKNKPDIIKNMARNVNIREYNTMFWLHCKNKKDVKKYITAKDFLQYRIKKFVQKRNEYKDRTDYDTIIKPLAQKYKLDVDMVRTLIWIESDFRPTVSTWSYQWLMAIWVSESKTLWYAPTDRTDPTKNIEMWMKLMVANKEAIVDTVRVAKDNYAVIIWQQDVYKNVA